MANEKPIPAHDDSVFMPEDGREAEGFTGFGDTTRKRFEAAHGRPMPAVDQDIAGDRKRAIEEAGRTDSAATRRGIRPRR